MSKAFEKSRSKNEVNKTFFMDMSSTHISLITIRVWFDSPSFIVNHSAIHISAGKASGSLVEDNVFQGLTRDKDRRY
jgi:hypothetical protein